MSLQASHTFEEHTGEVRLSLTAPTREALFAEAGRALAELMLGEVPAPSAAVPAQRIEVASPDAAVLLVEWLNELIYLSEVSKRVFTRFEVSLASESRISATAQGVAPEVLKTAVKAASLHGLTCERVADGWRASVVLDV